MAKAKKPTPKQIAPVAKAALSLIDQQIDCATLFAASEAIQQLIIENNCSVAKSTPTKGKK